jgi:hypothetical protein
MTSRGGKRKIERGAANRSNYTDTGEEFAGQSRPSRHEHEQQHPRALEGDLEAQVAFAGLRCRRRRFGPRLADQDRWGRGTACRRASSPVRMSTSCMRACARVRACVRASMRVCFRACLSMRVGRVRRDARMRSDARVKGGKRKGG